MSKVLKQLSADFRKYCETTSVRGIPRIFKTKSRVIRVVWILAVMGCFAMLLWQLSLILMRYFSYPTTTTTVQAPSWQTPTFPDITVCNQNPLVYESYHPNYTYANYVDRLNAIFSLQAAMKRFPDANYDYAYAYLALPAVYLNNFPINPSLYAGNSMILNCSFFDWNYNQFDANCTATVYARWDPIYYQCYTIRPNDADRGKIRGFSGIIYVEDSGDDVAGIYTLDLRNSRSTGVQVLVHPPKTTPDMSLGMSISPGTEASVMLQQTRRIRLSAPYSNCTTQTSVSSNDANVTYAQDYCVNVCLEQQLINQCGCISGALTVSMYQLRSTNFTICVNLTGQGLNSSAFNCYINSSQNLALCNAQCFIPCQEYIYDARLSTADWPQASSIYSFYTTFLQNQSRFGDTYDKAFNYVSDNLLEINATDNVQQYLQNLIDSRVVGNNFLQLNVMFGSPKFNQLKDVVAYPVETMGAQVGGQLSLYMGLTIMFAFETFEFIYTFIVNACNKNTATAT